MRDKDTEMRMRDRDEKERETHTMANVLPFVQSLRSICVLTVEPFLYLICIKIKSEGRKKGDKGKRALKV